MLLTQKQQSALRRYAIEAVKSEVAEPYHGRLSGYDRQAVTVDVLNHFEWLTNSDEHEELITDAVREAEGVVDPNGDL